MRIAITGASGFVGGAALQSLRLRGHAVLPLRRQTEATSPAGAVAWNPTTGELDRAALGQIDAVIHLAGANVAAGRWTARRRRELADSRGPVTAALCKTLAALPQPPRVLIAASATGIYGNRGDQLLDETSPPGEGFLAAVARDWEAATATAAAAGIRVVNLRIGMVLDPAGGALRKMLPPFRLGLGGPLGSGRQWMSWISRRDLLAAIAFALGCESLRGPALAVSPTPVTNREFTKTLAAILQRPTLLPAPRFVLRLALGQMADELLLASQRALPRALLAAGFSFQDQTLADTLQRQLQ